MHIASRSVKEQELIRLLLTGHTLKECAAQVGVSYWTIRHWAREDAFLEALKSLSQVVYERVDRELQNSKESMQAKLEEASEQALERIIKLAQQEGNDHIALKASQDILDRAGVSKTTKIESDSTVKHAFLDPMQLIHTVQTAKEMDAFEEKKRGALPPADDSSGVG